MHLHAKNKAGQFLIYSSCRWLPNSQLHKRQAKPRAMKSSCCLAAREKAGIAGVNSSPVIYGSYHAEGNPTKVPTSVFIFSLPARQLNMRVASLARATSHCRKQTNLKAEAAPFAYMHFDICLPPMLLLSSIEVESN